MLAVLVWCVKVLGNVKVLVLCDRVLGMFGGLVC